MVGDGVIKQYAIGDVIAAIYYLEPFDTSDLDIFVQVETAASDLMALAPIYEYLSDQGYKAKGEFIYLDDIPVQFLPVFNLLTEEAVEQSTTIRFARVKVRIMRPEHLVSKMLDTGRLKDYLRIGMFLEEGAVDKRSLYPVLRRHGLMEKWKANEFRFQR